MALLKLAFFADRYHTRKHARPISMDQYYAFAYGPGGGKLKDILLEPDVTFYEQSSPIEKRSGYDVRLVSNDIDMTQFSKSDIEAMEFSVKHFDPIARRYKGEFALSDVSHAYPEWDKYAYLFNARKTKREDIFYEDFLLDPNPQHPLFLKHSFVDPFEELAENVRQDLLEEMRDYSVQLSPPLFFPPLAPST
jgi:hypothetical protein